MRPSAKLAALLGAVAMAAAGCGDDKSDSGGAAPGPKPAITVGTKNFPEQYILGEIYKQVLEKAGFRVTLKSDIGSSEIIDRALTAGSLDMYPEYTGVLLSEIAGIRKRPGSASEAYEAAKRFEEGRGFTLLEATPFSDSNALAVTPAYAKEHSVTAIPDLKKVAGTVTIGAPPEFRARFEGLVGLGEVYDLRRLKVRPLKIGDQYEALRKGRVNAALVFTTDGQLTESAFRVLDDPKALFAFQNVAPVVKRSLVRKYGAKLTKPLDDVSRRLTTSAMRKMNAAVALRGEKPAAVAANFLQGR